MKSIFKLVGVPRRWSHEKLSAWVGTYYYLGGREFWERVSSNGLRVSAERHRQPLVYVQGETTVSEIGKILCFESQERAEVCAAEFYDCRPEIVAYEVWRVSVGTLRRVRGCKHGVFAKAVTLVERCATIRNCGLREECRPTLTRTGSSERFDWRFAGGGPGPYWLSQERHRRK